MERCVKGTQREAPTPLRFARATLRCALLLRLPALRCAPSLALVVRASSVRLDRQEGEQRASKASERALPMEGRDERE